VVGRVKSGRKFFHRNNELQWDKFEVMHVEMQRLVSFKHNKRRGKNANAKPKKTQKIKAVLLREERLPRR
jgi:hypothetical protein